MAAPKRQTSPDSLKSEPSSFTTVPPSTIPRDGCTLTTTGSAKYSYTASPRSSVPLVPPERRTLTAPVASMAGAMHTTGMSSP
ncbi:hypothetical protein T484DRAFT_1989918 [Baffinella frigidus]|nr:hypothetical protein T484DRAFT_1989918 [Cryptophyta sp. CCMP2293]